MEHNSAEYLHTVIEALSLSFADTLWYNADPSKIQVPVSGLLSKDYAAKRRSLIRQDRLVKILYSRTSCERPTRIRRFRGRLRELVAYESRPKGFLFQEEVLTNPLFGRDFIACNKISSKKWIQKPEGTRKWPITSQLRRVRPPRTYAVEICVVSCCH